MSIPSHIKKNGRMPPYDKKFIKKMHEPLKLVLQIHSVHLARNNQRYNMDVDINKNQGFTYNDTLEINNF